MALYLKHVAEGPTGLLGTQIAKETSQAAALLARGRHAPGPLLHRQGQLHGGGVPGPTSAAGQRGGVAGSRGRVVGRPTG